MKKLMGAVCLAVAGVALAGCTAASSPQSVATYVSPKKDGIQTLEYQGILAILADLDGFYGSWSEDDIRTSIDLTCDGFANDESAEDIRDRITAKFGAESDREAFEVQQVMNASVGIRCEEYEMHKGKIKSWDVSPKP